MNELWKHVDYDGQYEISNLGNLRHFRAGRYVSLNPTMRGKDAYRGKGYFAARLRKDNILKYPSIARLVIETFTYKSDLHVDHINGITTDNRLENLRYCTNRQNKHFANSKNIKKSSKYVGVHFENATQRWVSKIRIGDKRPCLGHFHTEEEAYEAYKNKLEELNLNYLLEDKHSHKRHVIRLTAYRSVQGMKRPLVL